MKKAMLFCTALLAMMAVVSCKEKKSDNIIIAHKPIVMHKNKTQKIGDKTQTKTINWLGAEYKLTVTVKADPSLPLASDGVNNYYDNRITVKINRADGSEFFNRTFSKADFHQYVDDIYYKDGALLGIVFDKVKGENLEFAATVGNPDKSSDELVPLDLTITHLGAVSVQKSEIEE